MKIALLSDLHANLPALDACLEHARAQGAEQFALLGALVGYGADPGPVLDRVMQLVADGALCVRGNHDDAAVAPPPQVENLGDQSAQWTHPHLSAEQRAFLAGLPLTARMGRTPCWCMPAPTVPSAGTTWPTATPPSVPWPRPRR